VTAKRRRKKGENRPLFAAWLAAHQKIIRADMENAGQFDQQINGAAALPVLLAAEKPVK